jgi:UDP-glucuronate decarboxylase
MRELATLIIDLMGSKSSIINIPLPPERDGDPLQRQPDITLAKSLLHWQPTVSLREGLIPMIEFFKITEQISSQS